MIRTTIRTTIRPWFTLGLHEDEDAATADAETAATSTATAETEGEKALGDAGKKALDAMKTERNAAKRELADAKAKLQAIEDAQKTDLEKAQAAATAAEAKAKELRDRALRAEIRAAADAFADPGDAPLFLDLAKYADGEIDVDQLKADLKAVLEAKPHLAKAKAVAANLGQGVRTPAAPVDMRDATPAEFAAELAKYGRKPSSR
jgi:hypothetical protein